MSGLEFLVADGGATVTAIGTAAAGWLGFRQRERDGEELATLEELPRLRDILAKLRDRSYSAHRTLTNAWGSPLSLFADRQGMNALKRGVPMHHVAVVYKAKDVVARTAALLDYAEIYHNQVALAEKEGRWGKGLIKGPVMQLESLLEDQCETLAAYVPFVEAARIAFESPARVPDGDGQEQTANEDLRKAFTRAAQRQADIPESTNLPLSIMRARGFSRVGEMVRGLDTEAVRRLLARQQRLDAASSFLIGPPPARGTAEPGQRYMFVRTTPSSYPNSLGADHEAVDVLRIHDCEPPVEVMLESCTIFRVAYEDLRVIAGFAPTSACEGEIYHFLRTSSYEYPDDCADKEMVEVIGTSDLYLLPAEVKWSSGHTYWVHFADLRIERRTRLDELSCTDAAERQAAAAAFEKYGLLGYSSSVESFAVPALCRTLQEDESSAVRVAAGRALGCLGDRKALLDPKLESALEAAIEAERSNAQ